MTRECHYCGKETGNPKYCSKNCVAKDSTNMKRRKRTKKCSRCEELTRHHRSTLCEFHFQEELKHKTEYIKNLQIKDYTERGCVKRLHASSRFAHIRALNRNWNKDLIVLPCANCGYDKHVELAHIRAISDFSPEAKLSEVNGRNNVIQLCPNCHWEFDNGLIKIEDLRQLSPN